MAKLCCEVQRSRWHVHWGQGVWSPKRSEMVQCSPTHFQGLESPPSNTAQAFLTRYLSLSTLRDMGTWSVSHWQTALLSQPHGHKQNFVSTSYTHVFSFTPVCSRPYQIICRMKKPSCTFHFFPPGGKLNLLKLTTATDLARGMCKKRINRSLFPADSWLSLPKSPVKCYVVSW